MFCCNIQIMLDFEVNMLHNRWQRGPMEWNFLFLTARKKQVLVIWNWSGPGIGKQGVSTITGCYLIGWRINGLVPTIFRYLVAWSSWKSGFTVLEPEVDLQGTTIWDTSQISGEGVMLQSRALQLRGYSVTKRHAWRIEKSISATTLSSVWFNLNW